ncbi:MAG: glycosyltransferase family 2 protein [Raoultibacter sp.]
MMAPMEEDNALVISLGVVALNEELFLPDLLNDIRQQDYPHDLLEIILVDGGSDDETKNIMLQFAHNERSFRAVVVLDNPRRIQAAGWNRVIRAAAGDAVIRVDAHASLPVHFVSANAQTLMDGHDVCGGTRPTAVPKQDETPWRETLHRAEESAFGSSVADYRKALQPGYVTSVFHGAYRVAVFKDVGVFDERLVRTEDNDLHYRIRQRGYKIYFNPEIASVQYVRGSLRKMLKQKYGNGYWIGRTLFVNPRCLQLYHFVPGVFVAACLICAVVGLCASWWPLILLGVLYGVACIALGVKAVIGVKKKNMTMLVLPLVFCGIHVSYGVGTLLGIVRGLFGGLGDFDTSYTVKSP